MGCSSGKAAQQDARALSRDPGRPGRAQSQLDRSEKTGYACFLSHYKIEAATEARWLQRELEEAIKKKVFLDSDDLQDLSKLRDHVRESKCILLLQTKSVLTRLWCLIELVTAIDAGVPIVGVSITSGQAPYDFAAASSFMTHLDTMVDAETKAQLSVLGVDVVDATFKLANTLPNIISVPLNMNESRAVLSARIGDIVGAMGRAVVPTLPDRDEWLAGRASAPAHPRHGPPGAKATLASLPPEVPTLPESTVTRPDLIAALKKRVLHQYAGAEAASYSPVADTMSVTTVTAPPKKEEASLMGFLTGGLFNTTAAAGMGGVGKTMMAAALVRDGEVRAAFNKICWVSVGQEPDAGALQNTLFKQLVKKPLPDTAKDDMQLALQELKDAAKDVSVLLVLDDVWVASHATPLNFIDESASCSAVIVTTRIRSLLDGVAEVSCGVLSIEASLELLLRAGGCEHLIDSPPPAALEAVELCGRLPLALGIAGGIIAELADEWQSELIPLLKEEFRGETVEERVVTASLRAVPKDVRASTDALFTLFAVFPEDAIVPAATIDVVTPLMQTAGEAPNKRQVRRCLQQLLKSNIMRGSINAGVSVHDLVRDCMIRRAEAAREGGLRATQRDAVPLLIAAFDAGGPAARYVSASLHWHVRQAQQPYVDMYSDEVMRSVLTHESGEVRKQGAIGIGVDKLRAAADACDRGGEHFEAAQLMWAAGAVRGVAAGAELRRAWASMKLLEAAGRGSSASRALESSVLNSLNFATEGGVVFQSDEYNEMMERKQELGRRPSMRRAASKEAFDAQYGLAQAALFASYGPENLIGYFGPMTHEKVVQAHKHWCEYTVHCLKAETMASNDVCAMLARSSGCVPMFQARQHALAEFSPVAAFGEGGAYIRETIQRYDFDQHHDGFKQICNNFDIIAFGFEAHGLLTFFGDFEAACTGISKVNEVHKRMLARVKQGAASADGYGYEIALSILFHASSLLISDDLDPLREFLANSLAGMALDDETLRSGLIGLYGPASPLGWKTEEGYCHITVDSLMLCVRGLQALIDEDIDSSRATLRAWLPLPAELLRIAEYEMQWLAASGASHPALVCARLHGERLGDWAVTVEVAEGVLRIEQFNPRLRTEALRLLGRAKAALGDRAAACEASELAASEASGAKYLWLEMLSLRDLLKWSEASEVESMKVRLRAVAGKTAASATQLAGVLGEGVLLESSRLVL